MSEQLCTVQNEGENVVVEHESRPSAQPSTCRNVCEAAPNDFGKDEIGDNYEVDEVCLEIQQKQMSVIAADVTEQKGQTRDTGIVSEDKGQVGDDALLPTEGKGKKSEKLIGSEQKGEISENASFEDKEIQGDHKASTRKGCIGSEFQERKQKKGGESKKTKKQKKTKEMLQPNLPKRQRGRPKNSKNYKMSDADLFLPLDMTHHNQYWGLHQIRPLGKHNERTCTMFKEGGTGNCLHTIVWQKPGDNEARHYCHECSLPFHPVCLVFYHIFMHNGFAFDEWATTVFQRIWFSKQLQPPRAIPATAQGVHGHNKYLSMHCTPL